MLTGFVTKCPQKIAAMNQIDNTLYVTGDSIPTDICKVLIIILVEDKRQAHVRRPVDAHVTALMANLVAC